MMDGDDVAIDGPGTGTIAVGAVIEKDFARGLLNRVVEANRAFGIAESTHSEPNWTTWLPDVALVLVECRLLEAFEDFGIIREMRRARPLVPIIAVSENNDPDFLMEVLKAGANDFFTSETTSDIAASKIHSFSRLSASARLIEVQNEELVTTMRAQREADEKRMRAEAEKSIAEAQAAADKQTREILDNLTEGFFVVEPSMKIGTGTSRSCLKMFGGDIAGKPLGGALSLGGDTERYLVAGIMQVFENFMPVSVTVGLLPTRVTTKSKSILELRYTFIEASNGDPERLIIGASDITDSLREKKRFENENSLNRALVEILKDKSSFTDFVTDFKRDAAQLQRLSGAQGVATGERILHTLKGNSAAYSLNDIVHSLHSVETDLKAIESESEKLSVMKSCGPKVSGMLEHFLKKYGSVLQIRSDADAAEMVEVPAAVLIEFSEIASRVDPSTAEKIRELIKSARMKPVGNLVSAFRPTIERLAERQNKLINLEVVGGDLRVDTTRFGPLVRSLIHSIRNSCDHGIEPAEERQDSGKSDSGTIRIQFSTPNEDVLRVQISDDGRGINRERVLEKAVRLGLVDERRVADIHDRDWLGLIFSAGFSTASEVTDVSGRGVGMGCIKSEVETLGGSISVATARRVGTKIVVDVPMTGDESNSQPANSHIKYAAA